MACCVKKGRLIAMTCGTYHACACNGMYAFVLTGVCMHSYRVNTYRCICVFLCTCLQVWLQMYMRVCILACQ